MLGQSLKHRDTQAGFHVSASPSVARVESDTAATIMIIDDDPGAVEVFEQILRLNGYRVCVASDAETGLVEIRRTNPSAVLLDLHLPMADGVELLRQLRGSAQQVPMPIAVVTGDYFVEESMAREIQELGARVHFKPLWEEDLLALVRELLLQRPVRT